MRYLNKLMFFLVVLSTPFFVFCENSKRVEDLKEYEYLDRLGVEAGTDKSSIFHNYTEKYAKYFSSLKDKPIRFLEIGIYKGDSVKMWENYFPYAELHFIDITDEYIKYFSNRSNYHFIDQSNMAALKHFAESTGEFDIIVDDGGHTMMQQTHSFYALFPYVKSGGMYIIEDLHTSYWQSFGGGGSLGAPKCHAYTTVALLQNLIHELNFVGAASGCADFNKLPANLLSQMNIYREQIYSMHFYDSMCFIIKK